MTNTVLFYDKNSLESCLSNFINLTTLKFLDIYVDSNVIDINNFEPNVEFYSNGNNKFIFVGCKPSLDWIQSMIQTVPNCIIHILYNNTFQNDYIPYINNVVTHKISNNNPMIFQMFEYIVNQYNTNGVLFEPMLRTKLLEILQHFNNFCIQYKNDIINPIYFDAYLFVNFIKLNISNSNLKELLVDYFNKAQYIIGSASGTLKLGNYQNLIGSILYPSTSIFNNGQITSLIVLITETSFINDLGLIKFIKDNQIEIDFIQYVKINTPINIDVYIKKSNMFNSILKLNNEAELIDYIGQTNIDDIFSFINNEDYNILPNGLIHYTTDNLNNLYYD